MAISHRVFVQRRFGCSPTNLFRWLVEPERIAQWFGPRDLEVVGVISIPRVGGPYSVELSRGRGTSFTIEGEFIEIDPPRSLVLSLRYRGLTAPPPDSRVRITVDGPVGGGSVLSLTQEFEIRPADMKARTEAWEHMLVLLQRLTDAF